MFWLGTPVVTNTAQGQAACPRPRRRDRARVQPDQGFPVRGPNYLPTTDKTPFADAITRRVTYPEGTVQTMASHEHVQDVEEDKQVTTQ
jgi:hypothetical protein